MALDQRVRPCQFGFRSPSSKADHPMILPVISSTVPNLITTSPEVARKPTQTVNAKAT